ncbi:MAG: YrhC family protein [Bacillus sp. (in: firmicutes)]
MDMKKQQSCNVVREKMEDYKRYAFILLCLSVFTYIGSVISMVELTDRSGIMMGFSAVLLAGAALFFFLSLTYMKKAEEEDIGL